MTSFHKKSWGIPPHLMDEQFAIHQWRFFGTICHGDKLIVSISISSRSQIPVDKNFPQSIGTRALVPLTAFGVLWYLSCAERLDDAVILCMWFRNCIIQFLRISFCLGHINNQYNTCFWMLVKSGKGKREAQNYLKVHFLLEWMLSSLYPILSFPL